MSGIRVTEPYLQTYVPWFIRSFVRVRDNRQLPCRCSTPNVVGPNTLSLCPTRDVCTKTRCVGPGDKWHDCDVHADALMRTIGVLEPSNHKTVETNFDERTPLPPQAEFHQHARGGVSSYRQEEILAGNRARRRFRTRRRSHRLRHSAWSSFAATDTSPSHE